ncbi:putative amidase AmiD [Halomonadaceae bacterium LMG 33818]|uniref:amidase family protein n=1 Tax=Cernens ardua TaxID=3402176 RepID=UPI003EDC3F23
MSADMESLAMMPLSALIEAYRTRQLTPSEVVGKTLQHIDEVNPVINALYDIRYEDALYEAERATQRWHSGQALGPWDGVPVTIKDSIHAIGSHWHHGSVAHGEGVLSQHDAPPVERLKAAGAVVVAKGTMPDFGMSASGVSSFFGITRNPWNTAFSPGGSSAGGGASLAAGVGWMAVGSDIAGSVRLPASHCGLAALKPTQGMIAHSPSSTVRSAGPITRYAADLEPALRLLSGTHPRDRFSVPFIEEAAISTAPQRIAVFDTFGSAMKRRAGLDEEAPLQPEIHHLLEYIAQLLRDEGHKVIQGQAEYPDTLWEAIDNTFKLRAWQEYLHADSQTREGIPFALAEWFMPARNWDVKTVQQHQQGIEEGVAFTSALFENVDVLLTPVMPWVNFPADQLGPNTSLPLGHCGFTAPFNQSGHPAVAIHAGFDHQGLPIGMQLVGRRFHDIGLIRLAVRIEQRLRQEGRIHRQWPLTPTARNT